MGLGICRLWERNRTVFLGSQCSHSDFITRRHCLWAWKSGSIVLAVTRPGCVHICEAAPGVSSPQASEVGMPCRQGTQCGVVSSHSRSGHISCCILAWYMFGVGSSRRWDCVWSLLKGSVVCWQGICQSYTLSRSGCTSHRTFPVPVSSWSQRFKQTPVSTSQAQVMECPFLPIGSLSYHLSNFSRGSVGNIDGGSDGKREGCRRGKTHSAQGRECQGSGASTKTVELASAKEATDGEYFGVAPLPKKLWRTSPRASQFSFQVRWGWTSFFLLSTQHR